MLADEKVMRAMHVCVLDMREGGTRRVRTALKDQSYGYKAMPFVTHPVVIDSEDGRATVTQRHLSGEWLVDVEVRKVWKYEGGCIILSTNKGSYRCTGCYC